MFQPERKPSEIHYFIGIEGKYEMVAWYGLYLLTIGDILKLTEYRNFS